MSTVLRPGDRSRVCGSCGKVLLPALLSAAGRCPRCETEGAPPHTIGRFRVLGRIGSGAMGVVYKCSQPGLDRLVAVKVIRSASPGAAERIARFDREVRAAARLSHPNVVQIIDVGSDAGMNYLAMEYIDGPSLDRLIGTPALTFERSLSLVYHVASAVAAAHASGMIHRDIKPSNILLDKSGRPKLADFGLAKSLWDEQPLSQTGDLLGTPCYMSPEQAFEPSAEVDARTDVYSLGAVLYEMLAGRRPVDGPTLMSVLYKLAEEEVVPVRELNPGVPQEVEAICHRALAKNRDDRYASAAGFSEAIGRYWVEQLRNGGAAGSATVPALLPELVTAAPAPRVMRAKTPGVTKRWIAAGGIAAAALLAMAGLWQLPRLFTVRGEADEQAATDQDTAREPVRRQPALASAEIAAGLVAQAREQLNQSLKLPEADLRRQRVQAAIEDLSAALRRVPDDLVARLLRGRARRATGENTAALDDLSYVLKHEPNNLTALYERLLAAYQFRLLYLGNAVEPLLQPRQAPGLAADVNSLIDRGGPLEQRAARLIDALARAEFREAARLADEPLPQGKPGERLADLAMVETDVFVRAANEAYFDEMNSDEAERPNKQARRQGLVRQASEKLARGLSADPNHSGLLFLKANLMIRQPRWDSPEADLSKLVYKNTAFQGVLSRLREATLQAGPDTPLAQAVLLVNLYEHDSALEHVNVALSYRPDDPLPYVFKAWLKLSATRDAPLASADVERMLDDLRPAFDSAPQDFNPYFLRAVLESQMGRWDLARNDVFESRRKGGKGDPTYVYAYNQWYANANSSPTEFYFATQDVLAHCGASTEVRVKLAKELLTRLSDAMLLRGEGIDEAAVRRMKGWTHYHLALCLAEQKDRDGTLEHLQVVVQVQLAELSPDALRDEAAFADWRDDDAFVQLLTALPQ